MSALLISVIINLAWGENIDCVATPEKCYIAPKDTQTFYDKTDFHNVSVTSFANNGEMTFKNDVYFYADSTSTNYANLTNDGVMNLYGDIFFEHLVNGDMGILNFNADNGYAQRKIENKGIINVNKTTTFGNQVGNQVGGTIFIKSPTTFNDAVINWDGYTQIGGTILVESPTTFDWYLFNYNNATIIIKAPTSITKQHIENYNGGTIIIQSPTITESWIDNYYGATLEIRGTTLTARGGLWNYLDATLIFSALNGELGQLVGNLTNQDNTGNNQGKVKVIVTGLSAGQKYQIVTGNATLDAKDISFVNGVGRYLGNGYILIDEVFSISTPIKVSYQANISTMNSMFLQSNAIMSSNKHKTKFRKMANLTNPIYKRILDSRSLNTNNVDLLDSNDSPLDSPNFIAIDSLQSNESFFYNNDSLHLADARNKAIKSIRQQNQTQDSPKDSQMNLNNDKYSFLFTPFINHTYFYESGNYTVSGLDGGFITAFSGKIDESNTLGTHFAFGYGSLGDKNDKDFKIASANLMLGLNYRLDLIYDMFLKARGDFYYFLNEVGSSSIAKSKPNNIGFGLSVAYGKDFDFAENGILGLELGLDYKMLSTSDINVKYALDNSTAESYNKAFYNLLYLDLGLNYYKYFSTDLGLWGLDSGLGIRGNLTPKISNGTLMVGNKSVDISLDNDNILAYLNIGGSYVLQSKDFNMEFTLRYNGSFGDKSVSNGGSLEWRVSF